LKPKNDSKEHIIPASIGGRKKVSGFICVGCNNESGRQWDSELAAQLNFLGLFVGIKRQRGKVNPPELVQTISGKKYRRYADGQLVIADPSFTETEVDGKLTVSIQARTMDEAKQLLARLNKKYPQTNLNEMIQQARETISYLDEPLNLNLTMGGNLSGRSVVKSCLALAFSSGFPMSQCSKAIEYLRNEDSEPCFGYFYERDLIANRPDFPFHTVNIVACPELGHVLAYVELYGVWRIVARLSSYFSGQRFSASHSINPSKGELTDIKVDLRLSREDVDAIMKYERVPDGSIEKAFEPILAAGLKKDFDDERDRVIEAAVKYGWQHCGAKEGDFLSEEHIWRLSRITAERLMPFIQRHMHRIKFIPHK